MNNIDMSDSTVRASLIFSKRMEKYDPEIKVAMGVVMLNLIKGCAWGITTEENPEFMKNLERFKTSEVVEAHKLKKISGVGAEQKYLIIAPMKYMISILNKEAGGVMFSQRDLDKAIERHDKAIRDLQAFMSKNKQGTIGIFNLNGCSEVIVNGKVYPAFSVTLLELIGFCKVYQYYFLVGGKKYTPEHIAKNLENIYPLMAPAPSGNALFITICK